MLIGQSGVRELLPRNQRNDENWIRKLFFSPILYNVLHMTSRTTEITMFTETNQLLLSWKVSQLPPYAQKKSARCRRDFAGSSKKPLLIVEASLKIRYNYIILICDSTGRSEILG